MLAALKDIIIVVAAITLLAYSTGQQEWLWKQIAILRREALIESKKSWGCPSIFNRRACTLGLGTTIVKYELAKIEH